MYRLPPSSSLPKAVSYYEYMRAFLYRNKVKGLHLKGTALGLPIVNCFLKHLLHFVLSYLLVLGQNEESWG